MNNKFQKCRIICLFLLVACCMTVNVAAQNPSRDAKFVPGEVIVKLTPGADLNFNNLQLLNLEPKSDFERVLKNAGALKATNLFKKEQLQFKRPSTFTLQGKVYPVPDLSTIYRLSLPPDADVEKIAQQLNGLAEVVYAEPNYYLYASVTPDDPAFSEQWYLHNEGQYKLDDADIDAPEAWDLNTGSDSIIIAVLDTGVDMQHEDLDDKIWTNLGDAPNDGKDNDGNGYTDDSHGWDFVDNDNDPEDRVGHGTHVAGIATAETDNGLGMAGVCWNAKIMPVRVLQNSGRGATADIANGIIYAANKSAQVINMSFSGTADSQIVKDALANAYTTSLLVASAGNEGESLPLRYPAAYEWVIGVGATDIVFNEEKSAYEETRAGFSNYGDWVDIYAPGVSIYSTIPDDNYASWNGTSMAAPVVTGVAGLLLSHFPGLSYESIRARIFMTGDSFQFTVGTQTFSALRLNGFNALSAPSISPSIQLVSYRIDDSVGGDNDGIADSGEMVKMIFTIRNMGGLAVNVTGTLRNKYDDAAVTISQDTASFSAISAYAIDDNDGSTGEPGDTPFEFSVDSETPNNHDVVFQLDITADEGYSTSFNLFITTQRGKEVQGLIEEDTTWGGFLYIVKGSGVRVAEGVTLTIEPGTRIQFDDDSSLIVDGTLNAIGTLDQWITFTSNAFNPAPRDWSDFETNMNATSNLKYCIIEYGFRSSHSWAGNISISDSIMRYNCYGVYFNEFVGGSLTITHCLIYGNQVGLELKVRNRDSVEITNNCIIGNNNGVVLSTKVTPVIEHNNIYNNHQYDFVSEYTYDTEHQYFDVSSNYWGTTDTELIDAHIFDFNDDVNKMMVKYQPILATPPLQAPGILYQVDLTPPSPVGSDTVTFTLTFSKPMDTSIHPDVRFGVAEPYTQHGVLDNAQWLDDTHWQATFDVDISTGDGINTIRVTEAKDIDGWEIPEDTRFTFDIDTISSSATNFMAVGENRQVTLSWISQEDNMQNFAGYNLYRRTENDSDYQQINDTLIRDTSYIDADVDNGIKYYYVMTVVNTDPYESDYSDEVEATPMDITPPTQPVVVDDGEFTSDRTQLHATWTSSDLESPIEEFQYAIGTSEGGTDVVGWTPIGTAMEVTHTGLNLADNITYYLAVKAKNDSNLWSEVGVSNGITVSGNLPPSRSTLHSPAQGADVVSRKPILTVNNSTDPEGDDITYGFEVYSDSGLTNLVASENGVEPGSGVTSWQVPTELDFDTIYYWRARANDGGRDGEWMTPASFHVVAAYTYGDTNMDSEITAFDAVMILQHAAEIIIIVNPSPQWGAAEVDGDGDVTAMDGSYVLQYSAGLINKFPIEEGIAAPAIDDTGKYIVSIPQIKTHRGKKVIFPIMIEGNRPLFAGEVELTFDTNYLKLMDIQPTKQFSNFRVIHQADADGEISIAFAGAEPVRPSNAVVNLTFQANPNGKSGIPSPIHFTSVRLNGGQTPTTKQDGVFELLPDYFALLQNYPNPFNPETWIPYELPEATNVLIRIYNVNGELVYTANLGKKTAGSYILKERAFHWDGKNDGGERVSNGLYMYNIQAGDFSATKRLVVIK